MARLEDMLPPGEIVRWRSRKLVQPLRIVGWGLPYVVICGLAAQMHADLVSGKPAINSALLLWGMGLAILAVKLMLVSQSEVSVTDGHVIWAPAALLFGRYRGAVPLGDIRAIDLEEGGNTASLHCGDGTYCINMLPGSDLEAMARAIGRPTRFWRKCNAPAARWARRLRRYFTVTAILLVIAGMTYFAMATFGPHPRTFLPKAVFIVLSLLLFRIAVPLAKFVLPHLVVGRWLSHEARKDFVGWCTDLRWRGIWPTGPSDQRLPPLGLERWGIRLAYGEIPDIGEREPEVLIPGRFPAE